MGRSLAFFFIKGILLAAMILTVGFTAWSMREVVPVRADEVVTARPRRALAYAPGGVTTIYSGDRISVTFMFSEMIQEHQQDSTSFHGVTFRVGDYLSLWAKTATLQRHPDTLILKESVRIATSTGLAVEGGHASVTIGTPAMRGHGTWRLVAPGLSVEGRGFGYSEERPATWRVDSPQGTVETRLGAPGKYAMNPAQIVAASLEYDDAQMESVYGGRATVRAGSWRMWADTISVHHRTGLLTGVGSAGGTLAVAGETGRPTGTAWKVLGDSWRYDSGRNAVTFSGGVRILSASVEVRGREVDVTVSADGRVAAGLQVSGNVSLVLGRASASGDRLRYSPVDGYYRIGGTPAVCTQPGRATSGIMVSFSEREGCVLPTELYPAERRAPVGRDATGGAPPLRTQPSPGRPAPHVGATVMTAAGSACHGAQRPRGLATDLRVRVLQGCQ